MYNEFGLNLKRTRESREMTQEQLAALLGTSKQVISRYETGQRFPKVSIVMEYADKLGISISQLTGYSSESVSGHEEKPTTVADDGLSDIHRLVIEKIKTLEPDQVRALGEIADSILRMRGQ